jgi:hypothetical protein
MAPGRIAIAALLVLVLLGVLASVAKPAAASTAGGGAAVACPACPTFYAPQPPSDLNASGSYECTGSLAPGTGQCIFGSPAEAEAACTADPGCIGYVAENTGQPAYGAPPGWVQNVTALAADPSLPNSVFYKRVVPAAS